MIVRSQAGKPSARSRRRPKLRAGLLIGCFAIQFFALSALKSGAEAAAPAESLAQPSAEAPHPQLNAGTIVPSLAPAAPTPAISALHEITNSRVPAPTAAAEPVKVVTNMLPVNLIEFFAATNGLPRKRMSAEELSVHISQKLEMARYLRLTREPRQAEPMLVELLDERSPELIRQTALLELAALAQDENNLSRAQQIYGQFLEKWPEDLRVPEILLRQGLVFRQMALYNLAFTKFYGVMTSALVLKNDQLEYYIRLVLQAQIEIAETQYELGRYADAADFFSRLLKQNSSSIDRPQILYKLVRCHAALKQYPDVVAESQDFLARYPGAPGQSEIRFDLAVALKELGRNNESLQQVLSLLQEEHEQTKGHPGLWAYWQQRAVNLIANQLYNEGDYTKALEIYLNLAQLDPSPQWLLPVSYQVGMTYERLWQPQKASETYTAILARETEMGTNAPPGLKAVFDMARWRIEFIQWQTKAEAANRQVHVNAQTGGSVAASLSGAPPALP